MKKLYPFLVVVLIGFVGKAQIVTIPDAIFKAQLLAADATNQIASADTPDYNGNVTSHTKIDANNDGEIQVSEALAIKLLKVNANAIADLTGIQSFTNLEYLSCSNNQLISLNLNGLANLIFLFCDNNQLTSINLNGLTNIQSLDSSFNQLPSLDLSGFTSLQGLDCSYNQLTSLNLDYDTNLHSLSCDDNQIYSLNVGWSPLLFKLHCSYNQIGSLNLYYNGYLQYLNCSNNQLSYLDLSGLSDLRDLNCSFNQLQALYVNGFTNLQTLNCSQNQLSSIDLSGLTNLYYLNCSSNQLPSLDVSVLTNLHYLYCIYNQLPSLNVSGLTNLQILYCSSNQLPSLNVSGLTNLSILDCSDNQLPSLNVSGLTNLNQLNCSGNQIPSIDVSGLIILHSLDCSNNGLNTLFLKNGSIESYLDFSGNPNLNYICADEGQVAAVQTKITDYGYANCHVNSYCSFVPGGTFYTIQGNDHYDSNANGCDASDINYPNLKLSFTDGANTGNLIADTTGAYHYDVQAGTQTITPVLENASYFTISPTTATVTFPTTTSPFVQDFCLTANGVHNDLELVLVPILRARPGFDTTYKVVYKNKGTQVQSGAVNLSFDDSRLDYVSATPAVSSQSTNSLSWNFSNLLPFETREILLTLNVNSPTETPAVNGGDVLNYTATVTGLTDETPNDNVATLNQTVVNSYDPNDKTCVEGTIITPSMVGEYVHYVVRFENDGTANAQNIVVKDMIDTTKFDISTLVPLSGSASYTTKISNTNQVEFIFQNINLPFAAGTNTGYVAFKIKTLPTLTLGNTFSNTANIYFDYNAPIVTNTATTTIATLGTQDFDFGSVFTLAPVPAKNSLTITTKQEVIMSSLRIYNTLGQLVQVITNPNATIDVSELQSGSYFVRIASDKGIATGKFIKE